jgi:hypothetical protein
MKEKDRCDIIILVPLEKKHKASAVNRTLTILTILYFGAPSRNMDIYPANFSKNKILVDNFVDSLKGDAETTNNALKGFFCITFLNKNCFQYAVKEKEIHIVVFNALMNHKDNAFLTLRLLRIVRLLCKREEVADYIFRSDNDYFLKSIATEYHDNAAITNTFIRIMVEIISNKNKYIAHQICTNEDVIYILHVLQFYYKRSSTVVMSMCLLIQHQLHTRTYARFKNKLMMLCSKTMQYWINSSKSDKNSVIRAVKAVIIMMEK